MARLKSIWKFGPWMLVGRRNRKEDARVSRAECEDFHNVCNDPGHVAPNEGQS